MQVNKPMHDRIKNHLEPLIRAAGISATAEAIGVSQASLSRWLRGDYQYSLDKLTSLTYAVGARLSIEIKEPGQRGKVFK